MTNRRRRIRPRLRPAEAVRLGARGAPDLLAVIPFLLGFHPRESVVTVFVRSGRIVLTARLDLPPPEAAEAYADMLQGLARQHGGDEVVVLGYSAQPEPARAFLCRLVDLLPPELVNEALYADGSRWWSMSCDGPCCPAGGTPYALDSHPLAAEAVFAGMSARADRDALAELVHGPSPTDQPRLESLVEELRTEQAQRSGKASARDLERLVRRAVADPGGLEERAGIRLALLVADVRLRDLAWSMIKPDDAECHADLWSRVVRRVPAALSAAPLVLAGMAAWIDGKGALLNCCIEELSQIHPQYSMGRLLSELSERAVSPRLWDEMAGPMRETVLGEVDRLAG
jgi:hypothetical protein